MTRRGGAARLREEKEQEVVRRLREARPFGDPSGNDEYLAIKEEEPVLEARISALEDVLARAHVVGTGDGSLALTLPSGRVRSLRIAAIEPAGADSHRP